MTLDTVTVAVMTSLVVNVCGIAFISDTLIRRDEGAGRVWSLGFLAGMLTTISYLVWAVAPASWWAIAVGNGAFVAGTGCLWLGCRVFNGRAMLIPSLIVSGAVAIAVIAVLVAGPKGGDWAGALWMFAALLVFAALGSAECLRGEMGRSRTSWGFAFVLGLQALYYALRIPIFLIVGPESELFRTGFGVIPTGILTVILTIIAVIVTSILRAGRAQLRGYEEHAVEIAASDGMLSAASFDVTLRELAGRASRRGELVGVIVITIDDIGQISTAFGSDVARAVTNRWRIAVRRYAPSNAFVGDIGPASLAVGILTETAGAARRDAAVIYQGMFEDLGGMTGGVIPVMGVGIGLSDTAGYDGEALVRIARDAAQRAATSVETSVLIGSEIEPGGISAR
ncbi:MAG: hypothetical protein KKH75_05990 [Actinobacteria bacterium]|nr:hypothetical protein [Actinomycetota bacterium]